MVDAAERYLDECGLDRPHLAGNSMGGFVAIELARRGRAASVCALSSAGFWTAETDSRTSIRPVATRCGNRSSLASGPTRLYRSAACADSSCATGRPRRPNFCRRPALEVIDDGIECNCPRRPVCRRLGRVTARPGTVPVTIAWGEEIPSPGAYDCRIPQASVMTLPVSVTFQCSRS
jgi:pimeloyl-ACP methyl ester carboxylesterase